MFLYNLIIKVLYPSDIGKTSLKIPTDLSEAVNEKNTPKKIMINRTLPRKSKIEQHESH